MAEIIEWTMYVIKEINPITNTKYPALCAFAWCSLAEVQVVRGHKVWGATACRVIYLSIYLFPYWFILPGTCLEEMNYQMKQDLDRAGIDVVRNSTHRWLRSPIWCNIFSEKVSAIKSFKNIDEMMRWATIRNCDSVLVTRLDHPSFFMWRSV